MVVNIRNKVYLDINETEYKYLYRGFIFYFSSKFYMEKFKNNVENFIKEETLKLNNKYKVKVDIPVILSFSYYKQIEKRGFKIVDDITKSNVEIEGLINNLESVIDYEME